MHDPLHDFFEEPQSPLESFFRPKSVALVGATEALGSVGRTLLVHLMQTDFQGRLYPVNPKRDRVLGLKSYAQLEAIPDNIDLVLVVTPSVAVPGIVAAAVRIGVKAVIVISAGFKESGPQGIALEMEIKEKLRGSRTRLLGPNCLGLLNPISGLNLSFAKAMPKKGTIAFLSQSGALLTAVIDWAIQEQIGFSGLVSMGSMLDVDFAPLIEHFGSDPETDSLLIYMESIGDLPAFLSAARKVALYKPILVIKAGRTQAAAQAAVSHTGSMTGSDNVLDEVFRRSGLLRVDSISELFGMAQVLAKQPIAKGGALTILTNAGGPAVLATDALRGAFLHLLTPETIEQLSSFLPAAWSRANPVDILGDADAQRYQKSFLHLLETPKSDGLLVILTPQDMTEPKKTAELLLEAQKNQLSAKPLLASWMGGKDVEEGAKILKEAGVAFFESPDEAAKAFSYMYQWQKQRVALLETPQELRCEIPKEKIDRAELFLEEIRSQGRFLLNEEESKQLLALYSLPTPPIKRARSLEEALLQAKAFGYPVVLKLLSETITHKTDVGGVFLNLVDESAVAAAFLEIEKNSREKVGSEHFLGVTVQPMVQLKDSYELIVGCSSDPQAGPVLMFGSGGQLVEIYKDYALALPPLNSIAIEHWMEKTKIYRALCGVRGRKRVDFPELKKLLMRFSQMISDLPSIQECEINPLLINEERMVILDARVVLRAEKAAVRPAIRPYPRQYCFQEELPISSDIGTLLVRPIRPEDEPDLGLFYHSLSERTIRARFLRYTNLDAAACHEFFSRICFCDYKQEIVLVVRRQEREEIVAIGRLRRLSDPKKATLSLVVGDRWQKRGIGVFLLEKLCFVAEKEKIESLYIVVQKDNRAMIGLCHFFGFEEMEKRQDYLRFTKKI